MVFFPSLLPIASIHCFSKMTFCFTHKQLLSCFLGLLIPHPITNLSQSLILLRQDIGSYIVTEGGCQVNGEQSAARWSSEQLEMVIFILLMATISSQPPSTHTHTHAPPPSNSHPPTLTPVTCLLKALQ